MRKFLGFRKLHNGFLVAMFYVTLFAVFVYFNFVLTNHSILKYTGMKE